MGISVILRPQGATSGGEVREIAGDGTIDNRAEAEAALALIGSSNNVVVIGGEVFDATRLARIRDGANSAPQAVTGGGGNPLRVGTARTSEDIPAGSRLYIFIDGNPSGDGVTLTADRAIPLTIPASTPDGRHEIQYRISRPGMPELRYTRITEIRPATRIGTPAPALDAASYANSGAASRTQLPKAIVNITGTTPVTATVRVNNHEYTTQLNPGRNEVLLRNPGLKFGNNLAGATAGTYPVTITIPGEQPISLSLTITGGHRGGGRATPRIRVPGT